MTMSKRHFEAVAEVLREQREAWLKTNEDSKHLAVAVIDEVTVDLCRVFAGENPRFDQARFMRAVRGER